MEVTAGSSNRPGAGGPCTKVRGYPAITKAAGAGCWLQPRPAGRGQSRAGTAGPSRQPRPAPGAEGREPRPVRAGAVPQKWPAARGAGPGPGALAGGGHGRCRLRDAARRRRAAAESLLPPPPRSGRALGAAAAGRGHVGRRGQGGQAVLRVVHQPGGAGPGGLGAGERCAGRGSAAGAGAAAEHCGAPLPGLPRGEQRGKGRQEQGWLVSGVVSVRRGQLWGCSARKVGLSEPVVLIVPGQHRFAFCSVSSLLSAPQLESPGYPSLTAQCSVLASVRVCLWYCSACCPFTYLS